LNHLAPRILQKAPGERFHQRTTGPSSWGTIAIAPSALQSYGRLLNGCDLTLPAGDQRRHLHLIDGKELLGLHRQAVHLAETALDRLVHPEIIRALEDDLIVVLMNCLINSNVRAAPTANRRQVAILTQFEHILSAASCRLLQVPEICRAIGVSVRMLRTCCAQVLGIGVVHYVHLRRLRQTRQALLSAEGRAGAITEVIGRYGFTDPRHFVMAYRRAFGEAPML
jgi:AraC-like DNA-binding protein